jgi:hypothetical protein
VFAWWMDTVAHHTYITSENLIADILEFKYQHNVDVQK